MKPYPVEVMGETGGVRVHQRGSGSNGSEQRSGTATVATPDGVPVSVPAATAAVAADLVAVEEGGCQRGGSVTVRGGGEGCRWARFPVAGSRRTSVESCTSAIVALNGALVRLYRGAAGGASRRIEWVEPDKAVVSGDKGRARHPQRSRGGKSYVC